MIELLKLDTVNHTSKRNILEAHFLKYNIKIIKERRGDSHDE